MSRVLLPVAVLENEGVPLGLVHLLGTVDVTVLGYYELPEQTPPDQARLQYEERANAALADIVEEFRDAGGDADQRLVFTADRQKTVDRVAEETDARAYALSGVTGPVDRLLVALSGDVEVDEILDFVIELVGDREIAVTLLRAGVSEGATSAEAAAGELEDAGIGVTAKTAESATPLHALVGELPTHDVVVMGERAPSLQSFLFGEVSERVAAESVGPVLVVRRRRSKRA
jgi:nucleotide-binding universal stress UspA family protein